MSGFEELPVLIGCHLLLKTVHNGCPIVGFEDIPHLGLSVLHAALLRQFVVGVHLYREPVVGVDNLHQQREIDAEMVKVLLTDELAHINLQGFVDGVVGQKAIGDDRLVSLHAGECPQLAAVGQRVVVETESLDFIAAPYFLFEQGHKL